MTNGGGPYFGDESPRGLKGLSRGYRTPDPSPSRAAAQLPPCKPQCLYTGSEDKLGTTGRTRTGRSSSPKGRDAGHEPVRGRSVFGDESVEFRLASRTPSPCSTEWEDTWSGAQDAGGATCPSSSDASARSSDGSPPASSRGGSDCWTDVTLSWPVQSFVLVPVYMAEAVAAPARDGVPPPPLPFQQISGVGGAPSGLPSVGSLNHPHGCADFCKYNKKARGCKDGDACVRCHLCTSKKPQPPKRTMAPRRHRAQFVQWR